MGSVCRASEVILPYQFAAELDFRQPVRQQYGMTEVVVVTDSEEHTLDVASAIKAQGFNAFAAAEFVQQHRLMYLLIFAGMTCVAAVALLVAASGSSSTRSPSCSAAAALRQAVLRRPFSLRGVMPVLNRKPRYPTRVMRERAWATRALARERQLRAGADARPSLLERLRARLGGRPRPG